MDKEKFAEKSYRGSIDIEKESDVELKNGALQLAICFGSLRSLSNQIRAELDQIIQKDLLYWT